MCFILVTGALILVVPGYYVCPLFFIGFQALLDLSHLAHDVNLVHLIVESIILLAFYTLDLEVETEYVALQAPHQIGITWFLGLFKNTISLIYGA